MRPDLIITWPTSCDFPVWRSFLRNNRDRFNEVFITMSGTGQDVDYTDFLEKAFEKDRVTFRRAGTYINTGDWRNSAVNTALANSKSEWVWFTEQDFFIANPQKFFNRVEALSKENDMIYVLEGERIHPACLFVKREFIDKTRKDFGIIPDKSDHFGMFVDDLAEAGAKSDKISGVSYMHMNGLTHNYALIKNKEIKNIYQPGVFQLYNAYARMQAVEQDSRFINLSFEVDDQLSPLCRFFRGR